MKWKDTGSDKDDRPEAKDPYYEDDGYAAFKAKEMKPSRLLTGNPVRYLYWGLGLTVIVCAVLLLILLFSNVNEPVDAERISRLEQRIDQLEGQLAKVDGVDEKVTRIWEQAKSFETFKTRFDRSEASMSLRMDHLAMSLDTLQKKTDEAVQKMTRLEKPPTAPVSGATPPPTPAKATLSEATTHTVAAGDTLYSISRKYGLTVERLRSINKLSKGQVIHVGQTLRVNASGN